MKQKISISIGEEKIEVLKRLLKQGIFRNKSHIIEYSLDRFLEEQHKKLNTDDKNHGR